jgi:hypothetical protein
LQKHRSHWQFALPVLFSFKNQNRHWKSLRMKINSPALKRLLAMLLVAVTAGSILFNCGGGGGSSSNAKTSNGGAVPSGDVVNPGLSGKLWLRKNDVYRRMEALTGVESTQFISYNDDYITASSDGQRFVIAGDTTFNNEHIRIHDVLGPRDNSLNSLEAIDVDQKLKNPLVAYINMPGSMGIYKFSLDHRFLALLTRLGRERESFERRLVILDLRDPKSILYVRQDYNKDISDLVMNFTWLPNGQYMYLRRDLQLVRGQASEAGFKEGIVGKVQVPPGMTMNTTAFEARPQGNQLIVSFSKPGSTVPQVPEKSDIWLVNTDGSNPQQVSIEGNTLRAVWAPNGETIMLQSQVNGFCTIQGTCTGGDYCKMWYVPKDARNVQPDNQPKLRRIENSQPTDYICSNDLMQWTQ